MFQLSFKNIQNIFLELSAGQVRQNCCATLVTPPGISVATIVTICCNNHDGEYHLHRITRKLGSTATSTAITSLLPLTGYISGAENETLQVLSGHTNGNIEMCWPSAASMMTMVAAATIVRSPQCSCYAPRSCPYHTVGPSSLSGRAEFLGGEFFVGRLFWRRVVYEAEFSAGIPL